MNPTVTRLTARSLLGRRRALVLLGLPAALLALTLLIRVLLGTDSDMAVDLLGAFALGTLMPLVGLIAGTGVIGPEIDDGSILYILAKPIRRSAIILSKLFVAVMSVIALGVLPVLLAGVILTGEAGPVALGYASGALTAAVAYSALFMVLAIVTRNAVVIGLLYALVWETVVGQIIPGAQTISVQQWSLAITEKVAGDEGRALGIESAVELGTACLMLALVVGFSTWFAVRRLKRLRLSEEA